MVCGIGYMITREVDRENVGLRGMIAQMAEVQPNTLSVLSADDGAISLNRGFEPAAIP